MVVRVGLCGFTMAMEDYAMHFPVVEVQNTFYEGGEAFSSDSACHL
jgi:uncharacterized protein YecE (DUF72 family)